MKIENHILRDDRVEVGNSPNQGGVIKPTVIVLHYTASGGEDGSGDATYLSRASSRASAHVVVGRNGSIDQIVPFNKRAWHAGESSYNGTKNVNDFSVGIEIDNWGWLDGKDRPKLPADHQFKGTRSGHSLWETYKPAQLAAVEEVIAALVAEYPITDIVGHEDIAPGRKQDPGPALDEFKAQMKEKYLGKKGAKNSEQAKKPTQTRAKNQRTTTTALRLRATASIAGTILTTMPEGATVELMSEWNGWSQVRFGNRVGFAATRYLT